MRAHQVPTTCIDLFEARPTLGTLQCLLLVFICHCSVIDMCLCNGTAYSYCVLQSIVFATGIAARCRPRDTETLELRLPRQTIIPCTFRTQATKRTKADNVCAFPQQHAGEPESIVTTTVVSMLVQGPISHPSPPREASIQQPQMAAVPDSYYSFHQAHRGVPAATVPPMHDGGERLAADGIVRVTGVQHRLSDAPGVAKNRIVRCRQ